MDNGNADSSVVSRRNRRFENKNVEKWLLYVGDVRCLTDFLGKKHYDSIWAPIKFLDALLRGYSQVVLANNPVSGFFIATALAIADPVISVSGLVTVSVGLLVSLLIDQDRNLISAGLTAFNPLLVGLITTAVLQGRFGLELDPILWALMLATAVFCVYVTSALQCLLGSLCRFPVPCFTLPFCVVEIMLLLTVANMTPYHQLIRDVQAVQPAVPKTEADVQLPAFNVTTTPQSTSKYSRDTHGRANVSSDYDEDGSYLGVGNDSRPVNFLIRNRVFDNDMEFPRGWHANTSGINISLSDERRNVDISAAQSNLKRRNESLTNKTDEFTPIVQDHLEGEGKHRSNVNEKFVMQDTAGVTPIFSALKYNLQEETENVTNINEQIGTEMESNGIRQVKSDSLRSFNEEFIKDVEFVNGTTGEPSQHWHLLVENGSSVVVADAQNEIVTEEILLNWGEVFGGVITSMSQVFGCCDVAASTVIYLAVLIYSPTMAGFGLLGSLLGTLLGVLLTDPPYEDVYAGVWGWNSALCTMSLAGFCFVITWQSAVAGSLCGLFGAVIQHVLNPLFAQANFSPLSVPFNLAAMLFLCITSANQNQLVRPESLTFPEKHRYDFQQQLKERNAERKSDENSRISSVASLDVKRGKKAPLAEQEVA